MVDTGIATIAEKHAMYFLCSDGYVRATASDAPYASARFY